MRGLYTNKPDFFSDIAEVIRLFIDIRRIERLEQNVPVSDGLAVMHTLCESDGKLVSTARLLDGADCVAQNIYTCEQPDEILAYKRNAKRAAKISAYRALRAYFGTKLPWGSLTGIRPTKLLRDSEALLGAKGAKALFLNEFDVSPPKYLFAKSVLDTQQGLWPKGDAIDVYIGIPFCVTRCAYCSFASYTPHVFADAQQQYVDALLRELDAAEDLIGGRHVRALYIGGGTPTALTPALLDTVLQRARSIAQNAEEITVEAGRPDTIDAEKLRIIKSIGAGRISVNAQTIFDETLERIGRKSTAAQFFEAYARVRQAGFEAINVDVIAGLPGELPRHLHETLTRIIALEPENITVHTLAVKRGSAFAAANMGALPTDTQTADAIELARDMLLHKGYRPYYMYRQKYMTGSLENAGYTKPGKACLYNIDNMEEFCDVLAFGAGAISKKLFCGGARIERAANVKDLRGYIERSAQMADAKCVLFQQKRS